MPKPVSNTLVRLSKQLFEQDDQQARFIESLMQPCEYRTAVCWTGERPPESPFDADPPCAWQPDYIDFVSFSQRPGRHELHDQGAYYCLDPSSVFTSQILSAVPDADIIFDLCASPGGKAILAWRRFRPQHLICNEVIGKRNGALISNLKRCSISGAVVTSQDVSAIADLAAGQADLVIVDAPCSGQSLVARGKPSPGCFHPATINMNSNRQRRILANAVRLLKPGGYLAYMTCTYAIKENERVVEWLLKKNDHLAAVEVDAVADFRSSYSEVPCYRMWPFQNVGAGGFAALFRSEAEATDDGASRFSVRSLPVVWSFDEQKNW